MSKVPKTRNREVYGGRVEDQPKEQVRWFDDRRRKRKVRARIHRYM